VDAADPAHEYLVGQQSLLAIPIFEHGVAQQNIVLTREEPAAFAPEQVPELVWMTNLFGRATQTLVLSQALQAAYDDAKSEIRAIAELQESLLPLESPTLPGLDIAAHYQAVDRAGGDYYDFFEQPDGSVGVLIADVSGHGTPAAVLMAITHSIAHADGAPTGKPGAFLTHLNEHLTGRYNRTSGSFVTAFYAVVNSKERTLTYASAGHLPPRFVKADGTLLSLNRVQRLPLGIGAPEEIYPQYEMPFASGDGVVLVTDGVTEAVNAAGGVFGTDRLNEILKRAASSSSDTLVRILAAIDRFADGTPQSDDRTVVVVRATE
jgi:sigma-B regulation protein RsbU (phosphoserine phosphatase)